MPDWLGDLVPQYLVDTNCLVCPLHARRGMPPDVFNTQDPKLSTCYAYEFCARLNPYSDPFGLAAPGDTTKSWKTKQLAHYGSVVPVLRCGAHGPILNLTYGGERWETDVAWETEGELRLRTQDPAGMQTWVRQLEEDRNIATLNQLAWAWATSFMPHARNGEAAVKLAETAAALTKRKDANVLDTLAVAYAEAGQFDKAFSAEADAIATLTAAPRAAETNSLVQDFKSRMELFAKHRPYHEE
jgi:hypothetical protein